jgi:hypothetical protein
MSADMSFLHLKKSVASPHASDDLGFFQCLLLAYGTVPVFAAALKEAVTHHALAKQKKDDHQDNHKQELPNSE